LPPECAFALLLYWTLHTPEPSPCSRRKPWFELLSGTCFSKTVRRRDASLSQLGSGFFLSSFID
jgi:hypothetical protein